MNNKRGVEKKIQEGARKRIRKERLKDSVRIEKKTE
jgi:hypothetical protein